jgi:hypothetical protein
MANAIAELERKVLTPGAKVRAALDLMVWQGHHRDQAAKLAGIKPKSLYNALRKHHVRQYYLVELGVLRESGRARVFHRLEELALQDENKAAAVKACQIVLGEDEDQRTGRGVGPTLPGLVIQIVNAPANMQRSDVQPAVTIEHEPAAAEIAEQATIPAPWNTAGKPVEPEPFDPTVFKVPRPRW